jgi:preprotein translocase subunit SecF
MLNIIGKRFWFFAISGIIILTGIIAMIGFGFNIGIEFRSGTEITIGFSQPVEKQALADAMSELGYNEEDTIIRKAGDDYIIDLPAMDDDAKEALRTGLTERLGEFQDGGFQSVSPLAAANTTRNAGIAVGISALVMLIYISWAFHKMPNPLRWGTCAIASLVHDILVVIGVFAILGGLFGWQVDLMFLAGLLTVIGYSVNDTIVIFDRIRENTLKNPGVDFEDVVNYSLVETLPRTLITGIGSLFVLTALFLVIGAQIQNLVIALLVGLITGTYSSFGTAASLLVVWRKREWGRFIGRKPQLPA